MVLSCNDEEAKLPNESLNVLEAIILHSTQLWPAVCGRPAALYCHWGVHEQVPVESHTVLVWSLIGLLDRYTRSDVNPSSSSCIIEKMEVELC